MTAKQQQFMHPILFVDFDDVLCLNRPYGGYDVAQKLWPDDLVFRLWHRPALDVLEPLVAELQPQVVVSSSWLRLMTLASIDSLFRVTGVPWLAEVLHPEGEAVQNRGQTRLNAIDAWLAVHHAKQPYAILDDVLSGTGLAGSRHDRAGRLTMCKVNMGLQKAHAKRIRRALTTPVR